MHAIIDMKDHCNISFSPSFACSELRTIFSLHIGRQISIEVNIQLWPSQTCHKFSVSNISCNHIQLQYSVTDFPSGEPLIRHPLHHIYRHSPPAPMAQYRMRCTGASESTVSAITTISNTSVCAMATSSVLLEAMSPSELNCTQLVSQPIQQT